MTVPATARRAGPFLGNGSTTVFPFTFRIFADTDIQVTKTVAGVDSAQTLGVHYTVSVNPDQAISPGGSIIYTTAPAVGASLTVIGALAYDQTVDLPDGGAYRAQQIEDALDRLAIQVQQIQELTGRSLAYTAATGPGFGTLPDVATRANKFVVFDANGVAGVSAGTGADAGLRTDLANTATGANYVGFDGGTLTAYFANKSVKVVNSIADLKLLDKTKFTRALVTGYYAAGDGGGGHYWYDSSDTTSADNKGTILVAADGGRWKLIAIHSVTLKQFGAKGDGATDDTVYVTAFRDYFAGFSGKPPQGCITAGTYLYSASPNWAIDNLDIRTEGTVIFRLTGTGNNYIFDAGSGAQTVYNVVFGQVYLEGGPTSGHGCYVRSVHHSHIQGIVRGCGTTKNALQVEFAVATTFDVRASVNENHKITGTPASGWYLDAKPLHGIYLTRRGAAETTTDCYFPRPIIEGVLDTGIICDYAVMNRFVGGTSEANNTNITCEANSSNNTFDGLDLEAAGSLVGIRERGDRNTYNECLNSNNTVISAGAVGTRIEGGIYDAISDSGTGTKLANLFYGSNLGAISDLGTLLEKDHVYNLAGGAFDDNQVQTLKVKTGATIKKHLSQVNGLDFAAPGAVPGFTAEITITVPGAVLGDTVLVTPNIAVPATHFIVAYVSAADTVKIKWGQLSGAAADPDGAGATYRTDVWGH